MRASLSVLGKFFILSGGGGGGGKKTSVSLKKLSHLLVILIYRLPCVSKIIENTLII